MTKLTAQLNQQLEQKAEEVILVSLADQNSYTGTQVAAMVADFKAKLRAQQLGCGDVVLIALTNTIIYPILEQAIWEIGAIAHPIAPTSGLSEIKTEFAEYGYAAGVFDDTFVPSLSADEHFVAQSFMTGQTTVNFFMYQPVTPQNQDAAVLTDGDLAVILNTSGSTGKPKRVGLTHQQILNSARHIGESQQLSDADTTMVVMPMFHVNAQIISMLGTRVAGGKLVVAEKFSASRFWDAIADHGVTWASLVPTIIQMLQMNEKAQARFAERQADVHMKYVRSASFSLPAEQLAAFQALYGIAIMEGYGMTESASLITLNPFDAPKVGYVGRPVATDIALLVDGQLTTAADVAGEILLRGDHVITDYVDSNPGSFHEGWLRTGDLGQFDDEGYLKIVGRIKEIISRGGEKVAPAAIENVLRQLPFIQDVVVVGLPDPLYGEAVTAAVIVDAQATLTADDMVNAINDYAASELSRPARPTQIYFVSDYPRNPTGKVMRHKVAEHLGK